MTNESAVSNATSADTNVSQTVTGPLTVDEAQDVYLKRRQAARSEFELAQRGKGEEKKTDATAPKSDADPEAPDTEDTDAPADTDAPQEPKWADDEAQVKIKVGDEEHIIGVKDLKRLFGQESALTKKSQEIAAQKKDYEARTTKAVAALETLITRANSAWEPYSKIDWNLAAQKLQPQDYQQLRADAEEAHANSTYLVQELDAQLKGAQDYAQNELKRQAQVCVAQLKDIGSPHYIEDWSQETYSKMREFATGAGLSSEVFDTLADPAALKIVSDAMRYREGKTRAKEVVTKAKAKVVSDKQLTPKGGDTKDADARDKAAMVRLKESGSLDDAAAVYMARQQAARSSRGNTER